MFGGAIDICPMKDGKLWWSAPQEVWEELGVIGESCDLDLKVKIGAGTIHTLNL